MGKEIVLGLRYVVRQTLRFKFVQIFRWKTCVKLQPLSIEIYNSVMIHIIYNIHKIVLLTTAYIMGSFNKSIKVKLTIVSLSC